MIRNTTLSAVACLVAFTAITLISTDTYSQRERPAKRKDDTQTNRKSKPVDDGFLRGQISTITDSLVTDEKVADASELSSQLD